MTRLDHMKHGSGIKDRDDRSIGIEIRITEVLSKINPTDPLILARGFFSFFLPFFAGSSVRWISVRPACTSVVLLWISIPPACTSVVLL